MDPLEYFHLLPPEIRNQVLNKLSYDQARELGNAYDYLRTNKGTSLPFISEPSELSGMVNIHKDPTLVKYFAKNAQQDTLYKLLIDDVPNIWSVEWPDTMVTYALDKVYYSIRLNKEEKYYSILSDILNHNKNKWYTTVWMYRTLIQAIERGNITLVKLLLSYGVPLTTPTIKEDTPYADIISYDELADTRSPLSTSVKTNNMEITKLLLENGAADSIYIQFLNNRLVTDRSIDVALNVSVISGYYELTKLLLEYGANPNSRPNIGNRRVPLMNAIGNEDLKMIQLLMSYGADPTLDAPAHRSPLIYAASKDNLSAVKTLVENGTISPNDLHDASLYCIVYTSILVLEYLLSKGVDVNYLQDEVGNLEIEYRSLLASAIYNSCLEAVKLLIKYGLDVNSDINKQILLTAIQNKSSYSIIKEILQNGFDINTMYPNGKPLLINAIQWLYKPVIKLLLDLGADVNAKTTTGYSVLVYATLSNSLDVVTMVLDAGVKVTEQDFKYVQENNPKYLELLEQYM